MLDINDYQNNNIKPHEKILVSKGKERAAQLKKVRYQICPIYLFFDDKKLKLVFHKETKGNPMIYFKSGNYSQSIFQSKTNYMDKINFNELFIADGHHRVEGFSQLNKTETKTLFLAVIFPKSQCNNLTYNRSVKFPNNYKRKNFLKDLNKFFLL